MPEVSLLDYLKENKVFDADLFDSLYFDIGCLVYYYGDHFINPREKTIQHKKSIKSSLKEQFIKYNIRLNILKNRKRIKQEPKIISNSYFTVNPEIEALGYNVYRPIWAPAYRQKLCANISLLKKTDYIKDLVHNKNFTDIVSPKFLKTLHAYRKEMVDFYNKQNPLALFVPNDISFMENFDVILCPVNPYPALPHGSWPQEDILPSFSYTAAYNLTGWPGAVVRAGTSPEGLPIGVQVVARPWREDVALAVAKHIEDILGGWKPPPL